MNLFEWAMSVFFCVLAAAVCLAIGLLPMLAFEAGVTALLKWGLLTALVVWFIAAQIWGEILDRTVVGALIGLVFASITFVPTAICLVTGGDYVRQQLRMAEQMPAFALEHFDVIDKDSNDVIVGQEIDEGLLELGLGEEKKALLVHMKSKMSAIGHVIGSFDATSSHGFPPGASTYKSPVYAVSRDDLLAYPQRVAETYKNW